MKADVFEKDTDVKKESLLGESGKNYLCFYKTVFIYILGGCVGTVWETLLNLVRGDGFVFCNGSIFTPFNLVYGIGAIVIIACLKNREKWYDVFIIGAFGGGAVEYILSFLEELVLGSRSWDYSTDIMNINGRTTVPYMVVWGLLCLFVIYVIYRPLDRKLNKMNVRTANIIAAVLTAVIVIDLIITVSAMMRYSARSTGADALTPIGEFIDRIFDDAFMQLRFPQMRFHN